jgi:hypothetical protein
MTNIRIIKTPHFTISAKYVSLIYTSELTKKRFLLPTIYSSGIIVEYFDELCVRRTQSTVLRTHNKSQHLKNVENLEKIKKYIEMDMGSSDFPVEYHQQNLMYAIAEHLRNSGCC